MDAARLRLEPDTAICWRADGSLLVGFNDQPASAPVLISQAAKRIAVWLTLIDGSRTQAQLTESGQAMGLAASGLVDLLTELIRAGHVTAVETINGCRAAERVRDLRHAAALRGQRPAQLLAERRGSQVLVAGAGPLAASLRRQLEAQWYRTGWQVDSTARIRPEDLAAAQLDQRHLGKRWSSLSNAIAAPLLVVAIADVHDCQQLALRYPDVAVLPVVAHRHRIAIGPLLNTARSRCADCLLASRCANDPDWTFTLTQLLHNKRSLPNIGEPWLSQSVMQLAALVGQLLDGDTIDLLGTQSLELAPPDAIWRWRSWPAQAGCDCGSAVDDQLQQLGAELLDPNRIEAVHLS